MEFDADVSDFAQYMSIHFSEFFVYKELQQFAFGLSIRRLRVRVPSSFKTVVMHHYLLEPDGFRSNCFFRISDRRRVIRNLVTIDFDIILCGHKHHSFVKEDFYGSHLDKRGRKRYAFNYLRRLLGIESLPIQFCYKGIMSSKYVTTLVEWIYKKERTIIQNQIGDD